MLVGCRIINSQYGEPSHAHCQLPESKRSFSSPSPLFSKILIQWKSFDRSGQCTSDSNPGIPLQAWRPDLATRFLSFCPLLQLRQAREPRCCSSVSDGSHHTTSAGLSTFPPSEGCVLASIFPPSAVARDPVDAFIMQTKFLMQPNSSDAAQIP
jgi:hypothetical protein